MARQRPIYAGLVILLWGGVCLAQAQRTEPNLADVPPLHLAYAEQPADNANQPSGTDEEVTEIEEIEDLESMLGEPGPTETTERPLFRLDPNDFVVTGFFFSTYRIKDETTSGLESGLAPIILWKISERLFLEAELELEWDSRQDEVVTELEYLNLSYLANDYLTVSAGKFLIPFGIFSERIHPPWINKLPDGPLPFGHDGLVPAAAPGVMGRGAFSIGASKFNYAAYLVSGPELVIEGGEAGFLDFEHGSWNWRDAKSDNFTNLAFGGRVGFFPISELELGYSLYVAPNLASNVDAIVHGMDVSYVTDVDMLKGDIDVRFEWLWSNVDDKPYGEPGFLTTYENKRNGGYVQVAYRPSKVDDKIVKNLEFVTRYDRITNPVGSGTSEQRVTLGVNYWISPGMVIKFAYQFDDKRGDARDQNAFFVQYAWGLGNLLKGLR